MEEAIRKADVLIEALPYIKSFHKKVTVIKYGGSILGEDRVRKGVLEDIVFLSYMGLRPVLVHGGGPNISDRMRKSGKKTDFVEGMRVTDKETLKIVEEELDVLNKKIVRELEELGGKAKSFTASKNCILTAEKKKSKVDLGLVGKATGLDTEQILKDISNHVIPVIGPMGKDANGVTYNINADEVASFVASALGAIKFVLLTNVKGIMRNMEEPNSLLASIREDEAKQLIKEKVIQEGMIPKIEACFRAIDGGVKKAHIIDAKIPHALLLEIFTDKGIGTEIAR
ncbi:MAG: acetylglutamate kinase [Candidatus Omnitrophica bacterium]|nr:acetylglutamate kinase [Candidatus Omnitrophota bacterium]MDD5352691.1 acetylglutamate kinase [Candidatus Omnitrophota bacterium]MDD5550290.1 acetylglutamate kinase [Candidatus Omnitrophota bacterium]